MPLLLASELLQPKLMCSSRNIEAVCNSNVRPIRVMAIEPAPVRLMHQHHLKRCGCQIGITFYLRKYLKMAKSYGAH